MNLKKVYTTFVIVLFGFPILAHATFADVSSHHLNYDAINYVQQQEMVRGYDDGTYRADATINRAEFTKIVTLFKFGQQTINACDVNISFSDVDENAWYHPYVCAAYDGQLVQGYLDGTYKPAQNINFVEAAKIISIADTFVGDPLLQKVQGTPWYEPYVSYLSRKEAIPETIHSLDKVISRGEMAEIIYRLDAGVANKTSRVFDEGLLQDVATDKKPHNILSEHTTGLTQYENTELGLRFLFPTQHNEPTLSGQPYPGIYNVQTEEEPSWQLKFGKYYESSGYDYYLTVYDDPDPVLRHYLKMYYEQWEREEKQEKGLTIFTAKDVGFCGDTEVFVIDANKAAHLIDRCGGSTSEQTNAFNHIVESLELFHPDTQANEYSAVIREHTDVDDVMACTELFYTRYQGGSREYINEDYRFSFFLPENISGEVYKTITDENNVRLAFGKENPSLEVLVSSQPELATNGHFRGGYFNDQESFQLHGSDYGCSELIPTEYCNTEYIAYAFPKDDIVVIVLFPKKQSLSIKESDILDSFSLNQNSVSYKYTTPGINSCFNKY